MSKRPVEGSFAPETSAAASECDPAAHAPKLARTVSTALPNGADPVCTPAEEDPSQALVGWCLDVLAESAARVGSELLSDNGEGSENEPVSTHATCRADAEFNDFAERLEEQLLAVDDAKRDALAEAWRHAASDAAEIQRMRNTFSPDSTFLGSVHHTKYAGDACGAIRDATREHFEFWHFNLAWSLAKSVNALCADSPDSGSDSEPVDESESEGGESGEESEEEESGDESESGEESGEEGSGEDGEEGSEEEGGEGD